MADGRIEILLTRLAGGPQLSAGELASVTGEEWAALDQRAAEHRLQPLLHARWHRHREVPEALRSGWGQAHRAAAIEALAQRRTLLSLVRMLGDHGIEAIALKGAWLAWHAFRDPAQRPLRDLDLLLRAADAPRARALLLAQGWSEPAPSALPPEEWLARFKHLPEQCSPEGHWLDLHVRLRDDAAVEGDGADSLWHRAVADADHPMLRYLAPDDLLMHLVTHAATHRFDGGPLMLADIDRLLAVQRFDWIALRARARAERWEQALLLVLAATRQWGCQGLWRGPDWTDDVPSALLADVPHLLAKPLAARTADIGAAKRGRGDIGLAEKARRIWARRERYPGAGDYLRWLGREVRLALAARGDAALAERARRNARLDAFLRV